MRAVWHDRYGGPEVLQVRGLPVPTPAGGEVLVRVRAASLNALDWHLLRGEPRLVRMREGRTAPSTRVRGNDFSGEVVATGPGAHRFAVGDRVFGARAGAFAEYVAVAERRVAPVPPGVSHPDAAASPTAALTALQALRDSARMQQGATVLVHGASGGVGTFAVQIARALGAATVTGVCSGRNVALVRSLGADDVIDYESSDVTRLGRRWSTVLDVSADRALRDLDRARARGGTVAVIGAATGELRLVARMAAAAARPGFAVVGATITADDLAVLGGWLADGSVQPSISRTVTLDEVPDAIRQLETMRVVGKIVVELG